MDAWWQTSSRFGDAPHSLRAVRSSSQYPDVRRVAHEELLLAAQDDVHVLRIVAVEVARDWPILRSPSAHPCVHRRRTRRVHPRWHKLLCRVVRSDGFQDTGWPMRYVVLCAIQREMLSGGPEVNVDRPRPQRQKPRILFPTRALVRHVRGDRAALRRRSGVRDAVVRGRACKVLEVASVDKIGESQEQQSWVHESQLGIHALDDLVLEMAGPRLELGWALLVPQRLAPQPLDSWIQTARPHKIPVTGKSSDHARTSVFPAVLGLGPILGGGAREYESLLEAVGSGRLSLVVAGPCDLFHPA
mmetsp:Transcript_13393/g.36009  ORF Transcript_13393/g.36009 Transcript_13393/m.36009 type:complete len:302 (-) Transcript_13393:397-1302(-)